MYFIILVLRMQGFFYSFFENFYFYCVLGYAILILQTGMGKNIWLNN